MNTISVPQGLKALVFMLGVSLSPQALTAAVTPLELSMLPAYCDAKMGSQSPAAADLWISRMGRENWVHIHHFCGGLADVNRSYRQQAYERGRTLSNALWEFNYMLDHTQQDFYMRADFYFNRGKAYRLLGKDGQAMGDFLKAFEMSPEMSAASIELADMYKKQGKHAQALAVLKKGLESSPSAKNLRRRYQEMGGDLSTIPKKSEPVEPQPSVAVPEVEQAPARAVITSVPTTAATEQKLGNESNPWCRFCPVEVDGAAKPAAY